MIPFSLEIRGDDAYSLSGPAEVYNARRGRATYIVCVLTPEGKPESFVTLTMHPGTDSDAHLAALADDRICPYTEGLNLDPPAQRRRVTFADLRAAWLHERCQWTPREPGGPENLYLSHETWRNALTRWLGFNPYSDGSDPRPWRAAAG